MEIVKRVPRKIKKGLKAVEMKKLKPYGWKNKDLTIKGIAKNMAHRNVSKFKKFGIQASSLGR